MNGLRPSSVQDERQHRPGEGIVDRLCSAAFRRLSRTVTGSSPIPHSNDPEADAAPYAIGSPSAEPTAMTLPSPSAHSPTCRHGPLGHRGPGAVQLDRDGLRPRRSRLLFLVSRPCPWACGRHQSRWRQARACPRRRARCQRRFPHRVSAIGSHGRRASGAVMIPPFTFVR